MYIQLGLEYDPAPPFNAGSPEKAPPAILARYQAAVAPLMEKRSAQAEEAARRLAKQTFVARPTNAQQAC